MNKPDQLISRRKLLQLSAGAATAALLPTGQAAGAVSKKTAGLTSENDLTWLPGHQLTELIAQKQISPVEVTKHFLQRIDRLDNLLHAYLTVDHEGALSQARRAEQALMRGKKLGPLHGLPISIKDLYMTKGLRTTKGSQVYKDLIPDHDEILVERLRQAGAIILGKTQTPEFATFPRTKTLLAGECVNPWDTRRITGASSGGSGAAVAAGISPFSIGSDGGGSTRIPACFNGVFGLQPSAGRIPMRTPHTIHMASAGPMTQYVRDAAMLIQVMSGMDARDPSAIERIAPDFVGELGKGIDGMRIAWSSDWGCVPVVDRRVNDGVEKAVGLLQQAGAIVESPNITLPDEQAWNVFLAVNEMSCQRSGSLLDLTPEQQSELTPPVQGMLKMVKNHSPMTAEQHRQILEQRAFVQSWVDGIFANHDLICTPTLGMIAPEIPEDAWQQPYTNEYYARHISTSYTYIANVLGLPAVSVPCGFVDGMPIGMQIIGPRFSDTRVMRAAQTFSEIQPWMDHHPADFI